MNIEKYFTAKAGPNDSYGEGHKVPQRIFQIRDAKKQTGNTSVAKI